MTVLAAYLLLFVAIGVGFIFVHLMAGKLIRPNKPQGAKGTIYECGEPTIGSSWIQFDLRFYVVALLFVIFDVEVAFFFPWAVVFGKANALAAFAQPSSRESYQEIADRTWELVPLATREEPGRYHQYFRLREGGSPLDTVRLAELRDKMEIADSGLTDKEKLTQQEEDELRVLEDKQKDPEAVEKDNARIIHETQLQARNLSWLALVEIAVFFGVLLVGYAYLWRRGDLAWVRSLAAERLSGEPLPSSMPPVRQPVPKPLAETVAHS